MHFFFVTVTITFQGAEGVPLSCFFHPSLLWMALPIPSSLSLLSTEPSHNSFSLKFSASLTLYPSLSFSEQQQQPSLLPPLYYILHSPLNPLSPPLLRPPSLAQSANFRAVARRRRRQSQSQFAGCAEGSMFLGKSCKFASGVCTSIRLGFVKRNKEIEIAS